ncbi:MAG TPA: PIG-L family deacetylase [Mycobacterium sp.]|nr:PIG-L family deacetylase [Mycobacterium sp.]
MTTARISNCARFAERSIAGGGTPSSAWLGWRRDVESLDLDECASLIVVAPHPDDETLGFGATAASLRMRGVDVTVVAASDGGGAYPGLSPLERRWLERDRRAETELATRMLGLDPPIWLGLPDGELDRHEDALADVLTEFLSAAAPGSWCAATWRGDGHPDHEAVGRSAAAACAATSATLLEYPVWMWHWAEPNDADVPWQRMRRPVVDGGCSVRKRNAANVFRTQLAPFEPGGEPILPPFVVQRLMAVGEMVFL